MAPKAKSQTPTPAATPVANKKQGKKSAGSKSKGSNVTGYIVALLFVGVFVGTLNYLPTQLPTVHELLEIGKRAENKPYTNFAEFYPFYKTQHSDSTCRLSHVVGTSLVTLTFVLAPGTLVAALLAGSLGMLLSPLLAGFQTGIAEGAILVLTFLLTTKSLTGKLWLGFFVLVAGYACAWYGHFFHEHNMPATFIYPTYSLLSDFKMFFNILTQAEPL
eukprot:m.232036 g.232036  ORF g.232036 m.232036 type:complete len:218 (-) comp18562_c0_seq1:184-837(-)